MKYQANPVIVDAYKIIEIEPPQIANKFKTLALIIEGGTHVIANEGMIARMTPTVGDYWVIQADGYTYLNPKDVFERKYSPVTAEE